MKKIILLSLLIPFIIEAKQPYKDFWGNYYVVELKNDTLIFKFMRPPVDVWEGIASVVAETTQICSTSACTCFIDYKTSLYNGYQVEIDSIDTIPGGTIIDTGSICALPNCTCYVTHRTHKGLEIITDSIDTIVATPCTNYVYTTRLDTCPMGTITQYKRRGYQMGDPWHRLSDIWVDIAHIDTAKISKMKIDTLITGDTLVPRADTANLALNSDSLCGHGCGWYLNYWADTSIYLYIVKAKVETLIANIIIGTITHADTADWSKKTDIANWADLWDGHNWGDKYPISKYADSAGTALVGFVVWADSAWWAVIADTAIYAKTASFCTTAQNSWQWNGHAWGYHYPYADTADYTKYIACGMVKEGSVDTSAVGTGLKVEFLPEWRSFTGHKESAIWFNEPQAYDDDITTYTQLVSYATEQWSGPLILSISPSAWATKISYYLDAISDSVLLDLDARINGVWTDLYECYFTDSVWEEKSFSKGEIDSISLRFKHAYKDIKDSMFVHEVKIYDEKECPFGKIIVDYDEVCDTLKVTCKPDSASYADSAGHAQDSDSLGHIPAHQYTRVDTYTVHLTDKEGIVDHIHYFRSDSVGEAVDSVYKFAGDSMNAVIKLGVGQFNWDYEVEMKPYITVKGEGTKATVISFLANEYGGFRCENDTGVVFKDFSIDTCRAQSAIYMSHCPHSIISNVKIRNCQNKGIEITNSDSSSIYKCDIVTENGDGVYFSSDSREHYRIIGGSVTGFGKGVYVDGHNFLIDGVEASCIDKGNCTGNGAISIGNNSSGLIKDCYVSVTDTSNGILLSNVDTVWIDNCFIESKQDTTTKRYCDFGIDGVGEFVDINHCDIRGNFTNGQIRLHGISGGSKYRIRYTSIDNEVKQFSGGITFSANNGDIDVYLENVTIKGVDISHGVAYGIGFAPDGYNIKAILNNCNIDVEVPDGKTDAYAFDVNDGDGSNADTVEIVINGGNYVSNRRAVQITNCADDSITIKLNNTVIQCADTCSDWIDGEADVGLMVKNATTFLYSKKEFFVANGMETYLYSHSNYINLGDIFSNLMTGDRVCIIGDSNYIDTLSSTYWDSHGMNYICGRFDTIRGNANYVTGVNNKVVSGYGNTMSGGEGSVIDSSRNSVAPLQLLSVYNTVGGGTNHYIGQASDKDTNVSGGGYNTVSGGFTNRIFNNDAGTISGGASNTIDIKWDYCPESGVISGGRGNMLRSPWGNIAGGIYHYIGISGGGTISGGAYDTIYDGTNGGNITGGQMNAIKPGSDFAVIAGGVGNHVYGFYTVVIGGDSNLAGLGYPGDSFAIAMGDHGVAKNLKSAIWAVGADTCDKDSTFKIGGYFWVKRGLYTGLSGSPGTANQVLVSAGKDSVYWKNNDTTSVVSGQVGWTGHCVDAYLDSIHGCSEIICVPNFSIVGTCKVDFVFPKDSTYIRGKPYLDSIQINISHSDTFADEDTGFVTNRYGSDKMGYLHCWADTNNASMMDGLTYAKNFRLPASLIKMQKIILVAKTEYADYDSCYVRFQLRDEAGSWSVVDKDSVNATTWTEIELDSTALDGVDTPFERVAIEAVWYSRNGSEINNFCDIAEAWMVYWR